MTPDDARKLAEIEARKLENGLVEGDFLAAIQDRAALLAALKTEREKVARLRLLLSSIRIKSPDADGLVWVAFTPQASGMGTVNLGAKERIVSQVALILKNHIDAALKDTAP